MNAHPRRGAAHLLPAAVAEARSRGPEAGLAGVRNSEESPPDPRASDFLPLADRFEAEASASRRIGRDGGERGDPRPGDGSQGLHVNGPFRVPGDAHATSASLGTGWFGMRRTEEGRSASRWQEALTSSAEVRRPVAFPWAVCHHGEPSFPDDASMPRRAFVRLGVDVGRY